MHHPVHRAVCNGHQVQLLHTAAAVLVGKIAPPPRAALLDTGHHLAPRGPCGRALLLRAEAALGLGERLLFFREDAWVGKRLLGAEQGEGLEAHVNAHLLPRRRQRRRRSARAREAHLPRAGAPARDRRRLGRALRKGAAGVASRPTKAGRAGLLTRSTAAEEGLKGPVNAHRHVLQHLRWDPRPRGPLRFAGGPRGVLIVEAHRLLPLFPSSASVRQPVVVQPVVVQPAALLKLALQEALLFFGWIPAVAERPTQARSGA